MRIITIVTLIYLPATFVSVSCFLRDNMISANSSIATQTFFSTDIVKYQGEPGLGSFSSMAMIRWLQVTVPLTVVTLSTAWLTYRSAKDVRQENERKRRQIYDYSPKWAEETGWSNFWISWKKKSTEVLPRHNTTKKVASLGMQSQQPQLYQKSLLLLVKALCDSTSDVVITWIFSMLYCRQI